MQGMQERSRWPGSRASARPPEGQSGEARELSADVPGGMHGRWTHVDEIWRKPLVLNVTLAAGKERMRTEVVRSSRAESVSAGDSRVSEAVDGVLDLDGSISEVLVVVVCDERQRLELGPLLGVLSASRKVTRQSIGEVCIGAERTDRMSAKTRDMRPMARILFLTACLFSAASSMGTTTSEGVAARGSRAASSSLSSSSSSSCVHVLRILISMSVTVQSK